VVVPRSPRLRRFQQVAQARKRFRRCRSFSVAHIALHVEMARKCRRFRPTWFRPIGVPFPSADP
jgi:hypothetical protein